MSTQDRPRPHGDPAREPPATRRRLVLSAGALLVAATTTTTLAAAANPPADASLYRGLRGWSWLEPLLPPGRWVLVGVGVCALLVLVLGRRCRPLQALAVVLPALAAAVGVLLAAVLGRAAPDDSPLAAGSSLPGPGVLALTAAACTVVVASSAAGWSPRARAAVGALLATGVVLVSLVEVHSASRWPLDVVASWLLAGLLVVVALAALEAPSLHARCRSCPWAQRVPGPERGAPPEAEPDAVRIGAGRARVLDRLALVWLGALVVGDVVLAATVGMPRAPGSGILGRGLEVPLQWLVLAAAVVGVLLARSRGATGGALVVVASALLGVAASVEYPPVVAVLVTAATAAPAVAMWVARARRASLRSAIALSVAAAVLMGVVAGGASATYSALWGPTHPGSPTPAASVDVVEWMWAGATTATGTEVRLRTDEAAQDVRVVVGLDETLADPVASVTARVDGDGVAVATVDGLEPGTVYHYAAEVGGVLDRSRVQRVTTFPAPGPASFGFVVGSCQNGGSNGRVFDAMRAQDPLFVLLTGDWHYSNIEVDDVRLFRDQVDANLGAPAQAALYGQASVAYVWDDHDYGGNDADRTSPSRSAAMASYRQSVPHYALATDPAAPIHQAFTVGRVRFLLTDTRSARDPVDDPTGPFRSALGTEQREWLLGELAQADRYGLVVWVSPDPWIDAPDPVADTWGGFAEERRLLADAVADAGVDNLLMLSGDAHMLAVDDGTNTDYSSSARGGFPLFHAAALDRRGSVKGGPYTGPVLPGSGQFGSVDVVDDGSTVTVTLTGRRWDGTELLRHELRFGP